MIVRMLGNFEVLCANTVVTPSSPRLRQILALLAVNANTVIRSRDLLAELWPHGVPLAASTTLETYIYQLRKLLNLGEQTPDQSGGTTEPDAALCSRPEGYLLLVPPATIDVHQFDDLATRGADEIASGRIDSGAALLRQALDLWRGTALADVATGPALRAEAARLERDRTAVLEQRIDADLHLGRHAQLLDELTELAAKDPGHHGIHARLLIALRRADSPPPKRSAV
jgi:DNA-binding SARP family transcriptional activator